MHKEQNKSIVKQYIEQVINTGNVDDISRYIADNYTEVFENVAYPLGIEGAKQHVKGVRATYPDLELSIDMQIAEGDWVATCYTMKGTHLGEWMGIRPTGKVITVTGVNTDKVVNRKIVEHSGAANLLHALLGIGAIQMVTNSENPKID